MYDVALTITINTYWKRQQRKPANNTQLLKSQTHKLSMHCVGHLLLEHWIRARGTAAGARLEPAGCRWEVAAEITDIPGAGMMRLNLNTKRWKEAALDILWYEGLTQDSLTGYGIAQLSYPVATPLPEDFAFTRCFLVHNTIKRSPITSFTKDFSQFFFRIRICHSWDC